MTILLNFYSAHKAACKKPNEKKSKKNIEMRHGCYLCPELTVDYADPRLIIEIWRPESG